jgi:hypothetical protein
MPAPESAGCRGDRRRDDRRDDRQARRSDASDRFAFYVEGPSDREILRIWARRLSPRLALALEPCAVILGGHQPARAIEHFRQLRERDRATRGVCVLDRDDRHADRGPVSSEPGLEFYTWSRRHIESYLLVPGAIGRSAGLRSESARTERTLREHLPRRDDEEALGSLDAKRLLSPTGALSRALGARLSVGRVARALRSEELHPDVHTLLERLADGVGVRAPQRAGVCHATSSG